MTGNDPGIDPGRGLDGETAGVIDGWAVREMAPWLGRRLDRAMLADRFAELHETRRWAALYRFEDGEVTLATKADPGRYDGRRADLYLRLFRDVLPHLPAGLRATLCLSVDDTETGRTGVPVFGFQREQGAAVPLLPDIDFLLNGFYEAADYRDELPFEEKRRSAVFSGATTGVRIDPVVARTRASPRLAAAAYFARHPEVDFRLPGIAQCTGPEAEQILLGYPFCRKPRLSWAEQFGHRFLISIDGNGATCSRVAVALASRCVLMKYASPHVLYYFPALQPWVHYVPIEEHADVDRIVSLRGVRAESVAKIAENGRAFARRFLTRAAVVGYTARVIALYAASLTS